MMKIERVSEAAQACAALLRAHAELVKDILEYDGEQGIEPRRLDEKHMRSKSTGLGAGLSHLIFMCEEIERMASQAMEDGDAVALHTVFSGGTARDDAWFVYAAKREKAMRWLGFVQGSLWSWNICSIDEMRRMNMPAETEAEDGAA